MGGYLNMIVCVCMRVCRPGNHYH